MCCDITTGPCAPCGRAPASADLTRLGSQVAKNVLVLLIMIDDCAVKGGYPHGKIHLYVISCHSTHLHVHFCCLCVKNEYILRKIKAFLFEACRNSCVMLHPGNSCGTEQAAECQIVLEQRESSAIYICACFELPCLFPHSTC